MKKVFVILLLFAISVNAQINKGKISLTLNDEKFDLPIVMVSLQKDNNIRLRLGAEKNDSLLVQRISMEMAFNELISDNNISSPRNFSLDVSSHIIAERKGKSLRINFEQGFFEYFDKGERVSFQNPVLNFKLIIEKIDFEKGELRIFGTIEGTLKTKIEQKSPRSIAEIKEGKFEIIF